MHFKNTDIPQTAIDAGQAAMTSKIAKADGFVAREIQDAVSRVLRTDPNFVYPKTTPRGMNELDMRVADRMIQKARRLGEISFANSRWSVKS